MARSSARVVSYDLRPAKQSERGILIDLLRLGGDCGLQLRDYRYIGMGANRFYDYLLIHKYVGIKRMVSLEHDLEMFPRAAFNSPYKFIEVRNESVASFLAGDQATGPEIFWLDYDGGIGSHITADIASACARLSVGDFCFVTVCGGPPKSLEKLRDDERLLDLREKLGVLTGAVVIVDVENSAFHIAVHKILMAAFRNAFAPRTDGVFVPALQVEYADSMTMISVGGAFLTSENAVKYKAKVAASVPFLETSADKLYSIRSLHLSERERQVFDRAVTSSRRKSLEENLLAKLGFKSRDLIAYGELVRYLPRYVESVV